MSNDTRNSANPGTEQATPVHQVRDTLTDLLVPIDSLKPFPGNARIHVDEEIRASLEENGQYKPITCWVRNRQILAGNGTWDAAKALGWTHIAATWVDCDEVRARKINAADNRLSDIAGMDPDAERKLLEALPDWIGTGYPPGYLAELDAAQRRASRGNRDPDEIPDPVAVPRSQLGDLWQLGDHRLLCGDSTKRETYDELLGADRPGLLLTDPPYGVSHGQGTTKAKAIRGDLSQAVIPVSFACSLEYIDADARVYLFGGSGQFPMYLALWDHHLAALPTLIVWDKGDFVLRHNGYHSQFECVYFGWKGKGGDLAHWYGDRKASDVWAVRRDPNAERIHSTQKPVALLEIPLGYSCEPGGLVLDPFGGSGSTLMAAELLGRRSRVIELDPYHVDGICLRWQTYTGELPVNVATGEAVDFTEAA